MRQLVPNCSQSLIPFPGLYNMILRPGRKIVPLLFACVLLLFTGKECFANIGIITAMDATLEQIKKMADITGYSTIGGRDFYQGKLGQTPIIIVRSPMGKVNNAITAQLLISTYSPIALLSISPAGGVSPDIKIGDVVLAKEVYQHDFGTWKPYGFIWGKAPAYIQSMPTDYNRFPNITLQRIAKLNLTEKPTDANRIVRGIIVSGDQFIASPKKRDWLHKKFNATGVDMGAAAIAQTCYVNKIPITLIRVITDSANLGARTTFAASVPAYRTTINLGNLVKHIVINYMK